MRCPSCGVLVSEWAATCPRCGTDVSAAPVAEGVREADVAAPRRGRRWRVPAIVAVAVAVGAAAALGAATGGPSRPRASPATVLDSLPYASTVGRYLPPSREQGDGVVVPVTLLDGRRFELAFPASLAVIASLGVAVEDSITVGAANPVVLRVIATRATVAQVFGSAHPRRSYAGPEGGRVLVFDGPPGSSTSYLVFRFGPWLLSVLDAGDHPGRPRTPASLTDQQWAAVASAIDGSVDGDGFLVLRTRTPAAVAAPGTSGSTVVFGAGATVDDPQLDIEDGYCGRPGSDTAARRWFPAQGGAGVAWCDPTTGLHVDATGTYPFVEAVTSGLSMPPVYSPVPRP